MKCTAEVTQRFWYENGKYLGNKAQFAPVPDAELDENMKHAMGMEIEGRIARAKNGHHTTGAEVSYPIRMGDWGEFQIRTYL